MVDKEPDSPDMVFKLFRERKGLTDESANSLSQAVVEAFAMLCLNLPHYWVFRNLGAAA